jgi:hypothetical protein
MSWTVFVASICSPPKLFDMTGRGENPEDHCPAPELLVLQRKSRTSLTSVSILGFVEQLLETKLSTVFKIPSMTYKKTEYTNTHE